MVDSPLNAKVRERIARDFPPGEWEGVESLLAQYPIEHGESERVQTAILDLAKGNKEKVAHYAEAARQDYRDVLYWAYDYENDPFRLLEELLKSLRAGRVLTRQEVTEVNRAGNGTYYRRSIEKLCQLIGEKDKTLSPEHYEMIRRLGAILKMPARTWKEISGQVRALPPGAETKD